VRQNVGTALQALGLAANAQEDLEGQVLGEVAALLAPFQGTTWPSGLPENN
jgi:hypothetical protein